MSSLRGQSRVIIENVQPQVDGGLYPAKSTVGDHVQVSADIFGDGHDHIRAQLLYKKQGEKSWVVTEMKASFNDSWFASFPVHETGNYIFTVKAWMDHLDTWYDGFKKKANAKVDVTVELMEGVIMLQRLSKNDPTLKSAIQQLQDKQQFKAIDFVLSPEFADIVHAHPLIEYETTYDKELVVAVEFEKANFSSWYELFPRSASLEGKHGTFKDVIKLLPRVASMGFDVLYFPPIHPIGKINRKGKNNNVRSAPGFCSG
jgi:starch synthase (maltosyl-transferring)